MTLLKSITVLSAAALGLSLMVNSANAVEASAKSAVNIRTGPGTGYAKVDALYAGEVVNITQCQRRWCYIQHPGPDGWVAGNYLIASSASGASSGGGSRSSDGGDAAAAAIFGAILGGIIGSSSSEAPAPAAAPALPHGPDTCKPGYVWREAIPGDHICVHPSRRSAAARENSIAGSRVNPAGGSHGANTCKRGFVWREAYRGDVVCVTPSRRSQVRRENRDGPSHRVVTP